MSPNIAHNAILLNTSISETGCNICGDRVNNTRYGAPACLGCTVFFRRTIVKGMQYKCLKTQKCVIHFSYRSACRYCRFQKCLEVGLRAGNIQRRDVLGPRKGLQREKSGSPMELEMQDEQHGLFLVSLTNFQRSQFSEHLQFFAENHVDVAFHKDQMNTVKYRRRARAHDVDVMLTLCLKQANDWGNQFKPFRRLCGSSKKSILAEYSLAFLLIDQGFKTSKEADRGVWLLQNGSFMHSDYFFGLSHATIDMENVKVKTQLHHNFVTELLHCVAEPFKQLEIDEAECAALKTILLLKPSCSERAVYSGQEGVLAGIYTQCLDELMNNSKRKFPDRGEERFGEILLLISSIRCGVQTLYNQTRVSDLFVNFDDSVKNILLV
uniref:Nuclear receptor domain-containing protein n=1 Tax=Caenorhabditis tropicalis TaxID=1561998 RepID=A0A1I7UWN1_9PELO